MQSQEKKSFPFWFGLDVSMDSFTVARRSIVSTDAPLHPEVKSYTLDKKGVREFLKWANSTAGEYMFGVAMEATGTYSKKLHGLIKALAPGQHVAVCNATSVSLYARSFTEEKNDKADAAMIARYACDRQPQEPRRMSPEHARLREIVRARASLVDQKLEAQNRMDGFEDNEVRKIQRGVIQTLEKAIRKLEDQIKTIVKSSADISQEVELMATVPGVGFLSAACIYAELGSLKNYSRKQVSALSGVCPINKTSGKSVKKHGISRKGPKLLRRILFLDTMQAIARITALGELHARLLARPESSKMTAKCACMRKLLLILHAMVVNGAKFDPNYKVQKNIKNATKTI